MGSAKELKNAIHELNKELAMEKMNNAEISKIAKENILKLKNLYAFRLGSVRACEIMYKMNLSDDLRSHLEFKVAEKIEELRNDYDMRTLPTEEFRYPDYQAERKLYDDIIAESKIKKYYKTSGFLFITEQYRSLFQIRHMLLWELAATRKEMDIALENERDTLLMTTDAILDSMKVVPHIDTNRKDRILTYGINYKSVPKVAKFLRAADLLEMLGD